MAGAKAAPSAVFAHLSFSPGSTGGRSLGHNYQEVRSIGRGSFGEATLAKDSQGKLCVIKTIDITRLDKDQQGDAVNEVKVLSSLKHPYIVAYHESFVENGTLSIVMDYAQGGDLAKRIARHRDMHQLFAEGQILRWFTQIALGLKYLHNRHILHRDLKPQNIFLTKQDDLRLGDFGISKVLAHKGDQRGDQLKEETTMGTPYYFSPEICRDKLYSFASDIWALGCILYELAALHVPFEAQNVPVLVRKITTGRLPQFPSTFSLEMRQLCHDILCRDHLRRPSAAEILQGPMIQAEMRQMLQNAPGDPSLTPPLSQSGSSGKSFDQERRMLGALLKPLASNMDMRRSPSAPVPSPAGGRNPLRESGSNALMSSNGAVVADLPDIQRRPSKESVASAMKTAWGDKPPSRGGLVSRGNKPPSRGYSVPQLPQSRGGAGEGPLDCDRRPGTGLCSNICNEQEPVSKQRMREKLGNDKLSGNISNNEGMNSDPFQRQLMRDKLSIGDGISGDNSFEKHLRGSKLCNGARLDKLSNNINSICNSEAMSGEPFQKQLMSGKLCNGGRLDKLDKFSENLSNNINNICNGNGKLHKRAGTPLLGMGACGGNTRGHRHPSRRRPALPVWQDGIH